MVGESAQAYMCTHTYMKGTGGMALEEIKLKDWNAITDKQIWIHKFQIIFDGVNGNNDYSVYFCCLGKAHMFAILTFES